MGSERCERAPGGSVSRLGRKAYDRSLSGDDGDPQAVFPVPPGCRPGLPCLASSCGWLQLP